LEKYKNTRGTQNKQIFLREDLLWGCAIGEDLCKSESTKVYVLAVIIRQTRGLERRRGKVGSPYAMVGKEKPLRDCTNGGRGATEDKALSAATMDTRSYC